MINNNITTIKLDIPPESIAVDPALLVIPLGFAIPRLAQIRIIDGSNDTLLYGSKILKLDPKYGDIILTFNPANHDLLATSLPTDTLLSWDIKEAENAIQRSDGNLYDVKEIAAGVDLSQVALNKKGDKIYIANPLLNTINVEKLESPIQ